MYLPILDLRMVTLVTDAEDKLVAVGISMPSFQRLCKNLMAVCCLRLVSPAESLVYETPCQDAGSVTGSRETRISEQGRKRLAILRPNPVYNRNWGLSLGKQPELEQNGKVQAQWEYFKTEQHKRRRAFTKAI